MTNPDRLAGDAQAQAKSAFWKAGSNGLARIVEYAPSTWNGPEQRFYRSEKELILEHASPFYWGAVVSGVLLLTFRISGSRRFIQFRERYMRRGAAEPVSPEKAQRRWQSYLDKQTDEKQQLIQRSLSLPTDLIVSLMCGCSSAAILFDATKFQTDLVRAPLLPGKSLVHTYMCHDVVRAYAACGHIEGDASNDPLLRTFQAFANNCTTRDAFIERRRAFGDDRPDVIPYPGLLGMTM